MNRNVAHLILSLFLPLALVACGDDGMPSMPDSGSMDSGGGGTDSGGNMDAGGVDAGGVDAGDVDAGDVDAGDVDAGDVDAGDVDAGTDAGVNPSSAQIAAARATADGTGLTLPVDDVTVTYVRGSFSGDSAGFFVQAEQMGPALFIAVDPASLSPSPVVGDVVSFVVEEMDTVFDLRFAAAISGFSQVSTGADVSLLTQDVSSATDLVSALDSYESELLAIAASVVGDFGAAGTGHVSAQIETVGITGDTGLLIRAPIEVVDALDLENGCSFTAAGIPMWRFTTSAQVHTWDASDLVVSGCPAPRVLGATAPDSTTVVVSFSRNLEGTSVLADGSQFTLDAGGAVAVSAASVTGAREVTLTTAAMAGGTEHTVTVASTVLDLGGVGIDPAFNSAMFTSPTVVELACNDGADNDVDTFVDCLDSDCSADAACDYSGELVIWELEADTAGTDALEFVEIYNGTGAPVDLAAGGYYLLRINGNGEVIYGADALSGTVADGDVFVAGSDTVTPTPDQVIGTTNILQNGADGVLLVTCATCTDVATDFPNGTVVTAGATFTSADGQTVSKVDGIAYDTSDADDAELMAAVGVSTQFDEGAGGSSSTESLQRISLDAFMTATPTPGAP